MTFGKGDGASCAYRAHTCIKRHRKTGWLHGPVQSSCAPPSLFDFINVRMGRSTIDSKLYDAARRVRNSSLGRARNENRRLTRTHTLSLLLSFWLCQQTHIHGNFGLEMIRNQRHRYARVARAPWDKTGSNNRTPGVVTTSRVISGRQRRRSLWHVEKRPLAIRRFELTTSSHDPLQAALLLFVCRVELVVRSSTITT